MTVNVRDYSKTAAQRGWGAGWPSCSGAAGNIVTVTADRSGARMNVHRRISVLVDTLADWTEAQGYLAKPAQTGAYNCRPIGGTNTPSNHSWGLAVDWNWTDNPYTTTGRHSMPDWMPATWSRYGFGWGGWYTGAQKDWMHLEFMGTPADADECTARALADLRGTGSTTPTAPSVPSSTLLRNGSTGDAVKALQARLNRDYPLYSHLAVDGVFGPATEAVVREFQKRARLAVDGIAGPMTLGRLGLT